ncbi:hypothetical protein KUTeg_003087 [Tegillarca granosa]|uniref:PLAT domain-containing protein n=1 Tax=Tegillarca granosa TaxID=220873 RepID=A0ABQ9FPB0_TEGGR|nr:hypothetical protein KUTeg_003087 [Tegillarca granosa]
MDTDSSDTYFYLMTIYTGLRKGSGTRSNINFVLAGEDTDTGVRYLNDESKKLAYYTLKIS